MSTILDIRNATVTYQDGETTTTALADASLKAESNSLTAICLLYTSPSPRD